MSGEQEERVFEGQALLDPEHDSAGSQTPIDDLHVVPAFDVCLRVYNVYFQMEKILQKWSVYKNNTNCPGIRWTCITCSCARFLKITQTHC